MSRGDRWTVLAATIWIQAFTGTNFDFSAYSSELKAAMGISQVQLSYLATASDLGKALGWSSGLALIYLPLPAVLLLAAAIGLAAYVAQWLLITSRISLPYIPVFLLCLLAGCSICWFNTVCFVLCIKNFPASRSLALSLTISFNGVSAALYSLVAKALGSTSSVYLLLNAALPLVTSIIALIPILCQRQHISPASARHDSRIFIVLNALAFITGLYLLFLNTATTTRSMACLLLAGAIALLLLPLCITSLVSIRDGPWLDALDALDLQLRRPFIGNGSTDGVDDNERSLSRRVLWASWCWCCDEILERDRLVVLGEEHDAKRLLRRIDFWLYYWAYFCGATIGLVYSNNIGQIAQSLGRDSQTTMLIAIYSSCSFFGRLLSAAPDYLVGKVHSARTGWLALALLPMPLSFFLLAEVDDGHALLAGTALVGLSSGFIFAAAVSVTSELFGPEGVGVNHNILITNIPLGSLLYGFLAAVDYDAKGHLHFAAGEGMVICMGRKCYANTFIRWGCITLVGLVCSATLYLRTRKAYDLSERRKIAITDGIDVVCGR